LRHAAPPHVGVAIGVVSSRPKSWRATDLVPDTPFTTYVSVAVEVLVKLIDAFPTDAFAVKRPT
jgi:hypothetical protein